MLSPTRLLEPLREFLREEAAGGILLMLAAAVALVIANSPAWESWDALWHTDVGVVVGDHEWSMLRTHACWCETSSPHPRSRSARSIGELPCPS